MIINKYTNCPIPPEGLPPCSECGGKWFLQSTEDDTTHWKHDCLTLKEGASLEDIIAHIQRRKGSVGS